LNLLAISIVREVKILNAINTNMAPLKSPTNIFTNDITENPSNLRRNGNAA
jgi:hypothetical protein